MLFLFNLDNPVNPVHFLLRLLILSLRGDLKGGAKGKCAALALTDSTSLLY
jgi:hypothetical protein